MAVGPTHAYQEQQTVYYFYIYIFVHVWHESTVEKQSNKLEIFVEPHDTADFFLFFKFKYLQNMNTKEMEHLFNLGGGSVFLNR